MQSDHTNAKARLSQNENLEMDFRESSAPENRSRTHSNETQALEIKGSMFTLPVLRLQSVDLNHIEQDLTQRLAQHLRFFQHAPVVIDLELLSQQAGTLDLPGLCALLRHSNLIPVGVKSASESQIDDAKSAGLAILKGGSNVSPRELTEPPAKAVEKPTKTIETVPAPAAPAPTKVVSQPVRSGQQIYARGGDLIVLAAVNAGAEVIADGNIHIYAPLRGRALAGVQGDESASIFTQSMEAELVAIAGNYQVFEDGPAKDIFAKSVRVALDNTQIKITPLAG